MKLRGDQIWLGLIVDLGLLFGSLFSLQINRGPRREKISSFLEDTMVGERIQCLNYYPSAPSENLAITRSVGL
jgi:hypothetical protein